MLQTRIPRNFIGIDMDAVSFDWYMPVQGTSKGLSGKVMTTSSGLQDFYSMISKLENLIIGIEGFQGQNLALEDFLRNKKIHFYSIPPYNVLRFREALISKNKNNITDAHAVASFCHHQYFQGTLEQYNHKYLPDYELRILTRRYNQLTRNITAEYSILWKYIKIASPDLYIALKGQHPDYPMHINTFHTKGFLDTLINFPRIHEWDSLKKEDFINALGGKCYVNRAKLLKELKSIARILPPI